jgi:hypothetical protein
VICFYDEILDKYLVFFTCAGSSLNGIYDNGASAAAIFTSVNLGTAACSEPIIDPDGNYLYYTYNTMGYKRGADDGAQAWATTAITPSNTSAPIVENDYVYFAGASKVYKYTIDNTAQGSNAHGSTTPLGMWFDMMYIANNTNYVYAVNTSDMTTAWTSAALGANTTSGVCLAGSRLLVGAGTGLKTITAANGTLPTPNTYTAAGTISSMPIPTDDAREYFFGGSDGKVYCVTSALANQTGWPKSVGGPVSQTPAVDVVYGVVVFVTSEGKVYAYDLP